jgi:hypothetical protein
MSVLISQSAASETAQKHTAPLGLQFGMALGDTSITVPRSQITVRPQSKLASNPAQKFAACQEQRDNNFECRTVRQHCRWLGQVPTQHWAVYGHSQTKAGARQTTVYVATVSCLPTRHEGIWGSGVTTPLILNIGTRWKLLVSFTLQPIHHQGATTVTTLA